MEEMLETVVCAPRRTGDESSPDRSSISEDYSGDEVEYSESPRPKRGAEEDYRTSLQIVDLQTIETDSASSPYSYAFRIDAFTRKATSAEGEFQTLGHGKYLRPETDTTPQIEEATIDPNLAEYLADLYFRELWSLFPVIDRDAVCSQLRERNPPPPNSLMTAIYFAAASTMATRPTDSHIMSPSLSPRSPPSLPPGLLESLRGSLTRIIFGLSAPVLEPRVTTLQTILLRCLYDISLSAEQSALLISDAVRIAQYIHLHRLISGIPSRDKTLRKHLWWTIFILEIWTSARDGTPPAIDLAEVDIPMPIESEETDHLAYTALVALTRILLDTLKGLYSPTVKPGEVAGEVERLRRWVMEWYCNLPKELMVDTGDEGQANFILAACHAVLLLLYSPFRDDALVRNEIERSRRIVVDATGKIGTSVPKFGIIANIAGEMARKLPV
jgi:hypothetical protein